MIHVCTRDNMHPYECDPKTCIHCAVKQTENHDPRQCWLCWDGDPEGPRGPCSSLNGYKSLEELPQGKDK
jgi:hypothetical protein